MFAGSYVAAVTGGGRVTVLAVSGGVIAATAIVNAFGIRMSGRIQVWLAGLLLSVLLLAVGLSLPHARAANLHPFAPHGWLAVATAGGLLLWSFAGWEAITHLAREFGRPARELPLAAGAAVAIVGIAYLAVAGASVLVLGGSAGRSNAPIADLLAAGLGGRARVGAAVISVILTFGMVSVYLAAGAKLGSALGRDGGLPDWFARGSEAGEVPRRSLAVLAALALLVLSVIAVTRTNTGWAVPFVTASLAAVYAIGTAAAFRLLPRRSAGRRCAGVAFRHSRPERLSCSGPPREGPLPADHYPYGGGQWATGCTSRPAPPGCHARDL